MVVVVMMMLVVVVEDVQDALDKDVQRTVGQLRHNGPPVLIRNHPVAGLERWIVQVIVPKNLLDRKKKTKVDLLGVRYRYLACEIGLCGGGEGGCGRGKGVSFFSSFFPFPLPFVF